MEGNTRFKVRRYKDLGEEIQKLQLLVKLDQELKR